MRELFTIDSEEVMVLSKRAGRPWSDGKPAAWIALTEEMAELLRAEIARTGTDVAAMLSFDERPEKLNPRIVKGWLYREAKSVRHDHWSYVIALLLSLPDLVGPLPVIPRKPQRISSNFPNHRLITDDERAALRFHRQRTDLGGERLLHGAHEKPDGLQGKMISGWLNGRTKAVDPAHIEYVLARYASMPNRC